MSEPDISSSPGNEDEYDPHLHRVLSHPNTSPETLLHIVKGILGTGILAMPEAFKYSGFVNGIISTILIGIFNTYSVHLLTRAQYELCKKRKIALLSYSESMKVAFQMGPECLRRSDNCIALFLDAVLVLYQIGVCSVYILFIAENMREVINYYMAGNIKLVYYILMCFVPFCIIASVPNLKFFAPFSLVGNIASLVTFGVCVYYFSYQLEPFNELKMLGTFMEFPLFFGTAMFALQSITVTTLAENNMSTPSDFGRPFGVLNIAMSIITILYLFFGAMGYWRYGETIKSSVTLNLPISSIVGQIVRILYSFGLFISYGLNLIVGVDILLQGFVTKRIENFKWWKKVFVAYSIRLSTVVVTFILSVSVPFLGLVISLLGNVLVTCLMFIFPALMEICACWPDDFGHGRWKLWKDISILVFGLLTMGVGTYGTIREIVLRY